MKHNESEHEVEQRNEHETVKINEFNGETPVNYPDIRESFALAMSCEGLSQEQIDNIIATADSAIVQNETALSW